MIAIFAEENFSMVIHWTAFIFISILVLILLIGVARWMEVPWVVRHLERSINYLMRNGKSIEEEPPVRSDPAS